MRTFWFILTSIILKKCLLRSFFMKTLKLKSRLWLQIMEKWSKCNSKITWKNINKEARWCLWLLSNFSSWRNLLKIKTRRSMYLPLVVCSIEWLQDSRFLFGKVMMSYNLRLKREMKIILHHHLTKVLKFLNEFPMNYSKWSQNVCNLTMKIVLLLMRCLRWDSFEQTKEEDLLSKELVNTWASSINVNNYMN